MQEHCVEYFYGACDVDQAAVYDNYVNCQGLVFPWEYFW